MNGFASDIKHGLRVYTTTPLSSTLAVLALAVSLAFVSAFLSLWNDLSLKPHPGFHDSRQIVSVGQSKGQRVLPVNLDFINELRTQTSVFASVAGILPVRQQVQVFDFRETIATELVSADYFPGLQPDMRLGRGLDQYDHHPDAEPTVVLGYRFWHSHYNGDPGVLGQTIQIAGPDWTGGSGGPGGALEADAGDQYRIVGVMAPEVPGTFGSAGPSALWMPLERSIPTIFQTADGTHDQITVLSAVARLTGNTRVGSANALLTSRYTGSLAEDLALRDDYSLEAVPGLVVNTGLQHEALRQVRLFLAGALLVALVAACNISLFLLARAPARRREMSIRLAVGATRQRLVRQLACEASVLTALATGIGILLALWLAVALRDVSFLQHAQWREVGILDWRVMAGMGSLALLLTILVAIAPLVGLRDLGLARDSRRVSGRAGWGQRVAGTVQFAVAGMLGGAAVAISWHLIALLQLNTGFDATDVSILEVGPPAASAGRYTSPDALMDYRNQLRELIESRPEVELVAFGRPVPGQEQLLAIPIEGSSSDSPPILSMLISADHAYPAALGLQLLRGRALRPDETNGILVNETLARERWGHIDILGERIAYPPYLGNEQSGAEIMGVVQDVRFAHPLEDAAPMIFAPSLPVWIQDAVIVRSRLNASTLRSAVEDLSEREGLDLSVQDAFAVSDLWAARLAADHARTWLTAASAALVVLLSGLGFYGTQRYLIGAGRREYAIRSAVGASPSAIGRLVMRRGLELGLPGALLGSVLAFLLVAGMRDDLIVRTVSPLVVSAAVAGGLMILILASVFGPMKRARNAKVASVLREE